MTAETVLSAIGACGAVAALLALWQNRTLRRENRELAGRADGIQERLAAVEEARRRDELRPVLTLTHDCGPHNSTLTIRNGGGADLAEVKVREVVEAPAVIARDARSLVGNSFPLRMGQSESLLVSRDRDKTGGLLVLRLSIGSGSDIWEQPVTCEVAGSEAARVSRARFSRD